MREVVELSLGPTCLNLKLRQWLHVHNESLCDPTLDKTDFLPVKKSRRHEHISLSESQILW